MLEKPSRDRSLEPPAIGCRLPLATIALTLEAVSWTALIRWKQGYWKVHIMAVLKYFSIVPHSFCSGNWKHLFLSLENPSQWIFVHSIETCSVVLGDLRILQWKTRHKIKKWPWKAILYAYICHCCAKDQTMSKNPGYINIAKFSKILFCNLL